MTHEFFDSEREMQSWLSSELKANSLGDLIVEIEAFKDYIPATDQERKIYSSFEYCLQSLYITEVLTDGENISLAYGDSLNPDFVLYAPETESIVIVEIKNAKHATREGGTEIGAYASELKSYVPFISDGDVINVIVSPEWPALIKHYIFHDIFWLQRNVICLMPITVGSDIKLKIVDIKTIAQGYFPLKIGNSHLGGYQLCLYDYDLYSSNDRTRLDSHRQQMLTALKAIAAKGNSFRGHGFAFLWKDNWPLSLAPYSITIINFASFQSVERLFREEDYKPNEIAERFARLVVEHSPDGHGGSLIAITEAGENFLKHICEPRTEGFLTWDYLRESMVNRSELLSFQSWGVFEELHAEKLLQQFENGNISISSDDPHIGLALIDELVDSNYQTLDLRYFIEGYEDNEDDSYADDDDK